ncbi:prion-inhibition and propagation-domain-containing protein [Triangularia verruculosa]|uniref:Prion-inhibition and propagation-domain-containing protein n=1 Tax=Triangularia verruculosa TaxID=2587418 RepID=A0AAN6XPW2_9PEZI|nr:prion-inhibition and propagation-domain-containing protein [Triangularia verruculosa]
MAETAGLVVGVLALAGLFNDCLELLSHISALRSMNYDGELLDTKLDVEKTLFLQWADRVRLFYSDCDPRLQTGDAAQTVQHVLQRMRGLMKDSSEIQSRYGLRKALPSDDIVSEANQISGPRMLKFSKAFEKLHINGRTTINSAPSLLTKARWVAIDKAKFNDLINDISYFIGKLNELIPPATHTLTQMALEDLRQDRFDSATLTRLAECSFSNASGPESELLRLAKSTVDSCRQRVLDALWFRKIDDRRAGITPAHAKTMEWAFQPPGAGQSWADLSLWLKSDSNIYWVSGKAGSGKSTLMKYIVDQPITKSLLRQWADGTDLISAYFFFYHLGTKEQKTFSGLTRTLLHHILSHNKAWIPTLLPAVWKESLIAHASGRTEPIDLPNQNEVRNAFLALAQLPVKFCFFIDGLDEYDGNNKEVIEFITTVAKNQNVKMLVSSRPELAFVDAFSDRSMLRMQDLTREDIGLYVKDKLESHRYMVRLLSQKNTQGQARRIFDSLCEKAQGVFLWIVLACRSLAEGLQNHDRISELEARMNELPKELEDMFVHMLKRIPRRYCGNGAKYIRIVTVWHLYRRDDTGATAEIRLAGLALLDHKSSNHVTCSVVSQADVESLEDLCESLARRLDTHCGGLVEADRTSSTCPGLLPYRNAPVCFLHRSVFEFLVSDRGRRLEYLHINDGSFDPYFAVSCSMMYQSQLPDNDDDAPWAIDVLTRHLNLRSYNSHRITDLLLSWQDVVSLSEYSRMDKILSTDWLVRENTSATGEDMEIALVLGIELGAPEVVVDYNQRHGKSRPLRTRRGQFPLLYHVLSQTFIKDLFGIYPALPRYPYGPRQVKLIVEELLRSGCPATESVDAEGELEIVHEMDGWLYKNGYSSSKSKTDNGSSVTKQELGITVWTCYVSYFGDPCIPMNMDDEYEGYGKGWQHDIIDLFLKFSVDKHRLVAESRANNHRYFSRLRTGLYDSCKDAGLRQRGKRIMYELFGKRFTKSKISQPWESDDDDESSGGGSDESSDNDGEEIVVERGEDAKKESQDSSREESDEEHEEMPPAKRQRMCS